jgi:D-sedoheptulose 7-phosphate isomerase
MPMIESIIRKALADSIELKTNFFAVNERMISEAARQISSAIKNGNKVLFFGNGGSAADAQHLSCELVGRFQKERQPLAAIALTTDTSILTSVGNDYGFEHIFAKQLRALGRKGDIAVAISTSGNSRNVLLAAEVAQELGLTLIGLTGNDGGKLGRMVHYHFNVPHKSTPRVQEIHIMLGHILCELVDEILFAG